MRRILLGAGVAALALVAFFALRHTGEKAAQTALDQALAALPPGYTATHGETEADALAGGMVIRDFTLLHDGAKLWSASRIKVSGADQQALRDVFDPSAYPGGRPAWTDRRKLLSHVEAEGLVIQDNDRTSPPLTIKRVSLDGLSGRPFLMPPTPENRIKPEFQADAALALAAASVAADKAGGGIASGDGRMAIGSIRLANYEAGKFGEAAVKDVVYERSDTEGTHKAVSFTITRLAVSTVDVRQWLTLVQQGTPDSRAGLATMRVGSADIGAVQIVQPGGPLIAMGSLHIADDYRANGTSSGTMAIRAMTIARHESPQDANTQVLEQVLGADTVVFDVDLTGSSDVKNTRVTIDRYDFDLHGLGTLRLSATMRDLPTGLATDTPAPAKLVAVLQTKVERARITWEDRGLANRLLAYAAQRAGSTSEALRAKLAVPLVASLAMLLPDQPDAADQVGAFLRDPKTLAITVAPAQPVSLSEAAQTPAAERAHLLGVSVKGD